MTQALIVIDTWDNYLPGFDYLKPMMEKITVNISNSITKFYGPVVLACYDTYDDSSIKTDLHWKQPHGLVKHYTSNRPNSIISWNTEEVKSFLTVNNVTTINYMGFSCPGCIMDRPLGYKNMKDNYDCKIVCDRVLNLLSNEYYYDDILNETYHYLITNKLPLTWARYLHG